VDYYSQESGQVIGSFIKGVSKFCHTILQKMPGFQIDIQDGRVKLQHISLLACGRRSTPHGRCQPLLTRS
jgi:hypothetical protein